MSDLTKPMLDRVNHLSDYYLALALKYKADNPENDDSLEYIVWASVTSALAHWTTEWKTGPSGDMSGDIPVLIGG